MKLGDLFDVGRIFYGIAVAGLGVQTIYYNDLPYMLIPPTHFAAPVLIALVYISGILLIFAGACIVFKKKPGPISLLLGTVLLFIFCFYYIPYEFMTDSNYKHLGAWENAEKELTLAGGAFVIASCFSEKKENPLFGLLAKLVPLGAVVFSIAITSFGIDHFLYAKDVADYIPSWVSNHMFWTYFAGTALISSGIAIILKVKTGLSAGLLGTMIFTWFIILHIPKVVTSSSAAEMEGEITSAFLALAYSGIAFVIASSAKKQQFNQRRV